jgi:phthiodiolone/phenolphthiodiolone dimycocerosates ketoreductase
MGGGPTLRDIATKYADGLVTLAPNVFATPEEWAKEVADLKVKLERNGRDPDDFDFALWIMTMQHDDPDVLERALANPLTLWLAGVFGRLNQRDWEREGEVAAFPADWHYALRLLPAQMTRAEVDAVNARVTPSMARKSFLCGPTREVAATIQDFIDAGATYVSTYDMTSFYLPLEEAVEQAMTSSVGVYRLLKEAPVGVG